MNQLELEDLVRETESLRLRISRIMFHTDNPTERTARLNEVVRLVGKHGPSAWVEHTKTCERFTQSIAAWRAAPSKAGPTRALAHLAVVVRDEAKRFLALLEPLDESRAIAAPN